MGLRLEWLISEDIFGSSCISRSLTFSSLGFRCGPRTEGAYRCPLDFLKNHKHAFKFFKKSTRNQTHTHTTHKKNNIPDSYLLLGTHILWLASTGESN